MKRLRTVFAATKITFFALLIAGCLSAPAKAACPAGDIDGDCAVDFVDLMLLGEQWLNNSSTSADLTEDANVNAVDFAVMAADWLEDEKPLQITELVASNISGLADEDGNYCDWVEIYNRSHFDVNLDGWYLTDNAGDLTRWQFPAVVLEPGEFLVVFASAKDRSTNPNELHTNFRLDRQGEYLALIKPDGETISSEYDEFPLQFNDISYGLSSGGSMQYFQSPTPGSQNASGFDGYAESAEFSQDAGVFITAFSLALTADSPTAQIRYTTNGSEPTETSTLYSTPISISTTTEVRAKVYDANMLPGEVESKAYLALNADVQNFNSNLPMAIAETFGNTIPPTASTSYAPSYLVFVDSNDGNRVNITDVVDFTGRCGLRERGSSASSFPKKMYACEVWDEENEDKNVSILGLPKESDWILYGPYMDKTLMRNVLSYRWSRAMGIYAPRTVFFEMFLNNDGDSEISYADDYVGLYVLVEKIKRDKNRLDIAELEPSDNAEPEITGGYIVKKDRLDPGDSGFNTLKMGQMAYVEPKESELSPLQAAWIRNYIWEFETVLDDPDFADPVTGYAEYIDVDSFIDQHILTEFAKNIDGYRLSTFMYKDRGEKLKMGPAWDYNLSMGNCNYDNIIWHETAGWYYSLIYPEHSWYDRLMEDDEYLLRDADRWFELRETIFSDESINNDVNELTDLLAEAGARNFIKWNILNSHVWPNWYHGSPSDPHTYQMEIDWVNRWLTGTDAPQEDPDPEHTDRAGWIDDNLSFEAPPTFYINSTEQNTNCYIDVNAQLAMTASTTGTIYYTTDGNDPRLFGGSVNSDAVVFSGGGSYLPETFIAQGADWKYLDNGSDQGTAWQALAFDDSSWASGPAELGYGDGDEATVVSYGGDEDDKYITTYFRNTFDVNDASQVSDLTLEILRDDGAVFYLNGTEIDRDNMPTGTIDYQTVATTYTPHETTFFGFPVDTNLLVDGNNVIAVEIHQNVKTSSDISFDFKLYGTIYTPPDSIALAETTCIKARSLDGSNWSALNEATYAVSGVKENLRISEIMYHPKDANDPNTEFVELQNIGANTINLKLVEFTNGIDFIFGWLELEPNEYIVVVKNQTEFESQYTDVNIAGVYIGQLDNGGERIKIEDAIGETILDFDYEDNWYSITDGGGFSLTLISPAATDINDFNNEDSWRASTFIGGSPGEADTSPAPGDVVINEVLSHSHAAAPDWVELYNTTSSAINIGGWFLSDNDSDDANLMKYKIADGTVIAANDYIVFYEDTNFGNPNESGCNDAFALSENGETAYLSSGQGGVLTGYREQEDFGASETGVAFGRYLKSTGTYNFVSMSSNTPGAENAYPKVGPIVINEIMYHPAVNADAEYIELYNLSASSVDLYDSEQVASWAFTEGIDLIFAADANIPAYGYMLLVKDIAVFESEFGSAPAGVEVVQWTDGSLSNGGEKVEISMPGDMVSGTRYYIRVDRVTYEDIAPWPTEPDGYGDSLSRIFPQCYGNDPNNWSAETPSPGAVNP
ncbi:MAG: lamin tail domain-containing protein [Planctomycetes bacterium]|nr:lamin tail domain-containing protein [Planctomycetota bacterium]